MKRNTARAMQKQPENNEQTFIDLPIYEQFSADEFITMPSNEMAVKFINHWSEIQAPRHSLLIGPSGSGKTHLLSIWKNLNDGIILNPDSFSLPIFNHLMTQNKPIAIDRIDEIIAADPENETLLFHFYNILTEAKIDCFFTSQKPLSEWSLTLKDLKTRLNVFHVVELHAPEEELLTYILIRLFHTRQLLLNPTIISYLVKQIQKRTLNCRHIVENIDHTALKEKRKISLNFVKEIIATL